MRLYFLLFVVLIIAGVTYLVMQDVNIEQKTIVKEVQLSVTTE